MGGKPITRRCAQKLDALGEEKVFELYLEHRSVRRLLKVLPPSVGSMSSGPFYAWLKSDPERYERWQIAKAMIASDLVEEALQIVDESDDGTVQSARLRAEQRRWMAERYDRTSFGKNSSVNVGVVTSFSDDWLTALKRVEEKHKKKSEEEEISGEYEVISE